jgi:hypothetical protein
MQTTRKSKSLRLGEQDIEKWLDQLTKNRALFTHLGRSLRSKVVDKDVCS